MIHVGELSYYQEIQNRLEDCDLVLFEGVSSSWASALNFSYRLVGKSKRLDLITQKDAMDMNVLKGQSTCVDISGKEFTKSLKDIPFRVRLFMVIGVPICSVYLFLFASRHKIAAHLGTGDLQSREEILEDKEFESLNELVLNKRDLIVVRTIQQIFDQRKTETIEVGIVYGAKHMRSISGFLLSKLRFNVSGAEWVTVFNL